jgi:Zn-dependent protease with chaperone function
MKKAIALLGFLLGTTGWAGDRDLTICMVPTAELEDAQTLSQAESYTTRIYGSIKVTLHWKSRCGQVELEAPGTRLMPNLTTLGIKFAATAPAAVEPGAFASAQPFEATGVRITVYRDRLASPAHDHDRAVLLGHVLAHEIGHILLGHNGHAPAGLMQPSWSRGEQALMRYRLLSFTASEGDNIRGRLDGRSERLAALNQSRQ